MVKSRCVRPTRHRRLPCSCPGFGYDLPATHVEVSARALGEKWGARTPGGRTGRIDKGRRFLSQKRLWGRSGSFVDPKSPP